MLMEVLPAMDLQQRSAGEGDRTRRGWRVHADGTRACHGVASAKGWTFSLNAACCHPWNSKLRLYAYSIPWNIFLLTVGSFLVAMSIKSVAVPHGFVTGGVSGIALLIYYFTETLTPGLWLLRPEHSHRRDRLGHDQPQVRAVHGLRHVRHHGLDGDHQLHPSRARPSARSHCRWGHAPARDRG